ncbi:threonine-phosphate decarboxylase [Neobacillus sp. MM2021_6]|uniref:threonine-phosphate decarboxylase CobD n=1 Tax=Bacillaceae TaxID=186817 RepID=UPI00140BFA91|nr:MULTISPECIES: threonine-phosphate decarboxylase CobD [Bacillaceae]MBO0961851.1 threonine-phosphate decarboxylase [Neobacillus sp. MM2021_6]NHC20272.1 threonine-phosphate decarboxylase [Bacillus sp. MM2020_4]
MNWPSHGSNPQYLYKAMGQPLPVDYTDFSANINPLGPPSSLKEKWPEFYQEIFVYPDPHAIKLKKIIAQKERIPDQSILIGNGGAELISLIARLLTGKRVLLIQPTFSEYENACKANNCDVVYHQLREPDFDLNLDELHKKIEIADALFLCNPNNPTGIQYPSSTIISLIEKCEQQKCLVILDEAFFDFLEEYESFIPYINTCSNLIIIRSMTKMFTIPGIRLGYLVALPAIVERLNSLQAHWSINTLALLAGELCLQDESFIQLTREYICEERKRLFTFFKQHGFVVSSSKVNFYLLKDPLLDDQFPLFEFLLNKAVIPRHTVNFPGLEGKWLRFAIKGREANTSLMEVLADWHNHH